MKILIEAVNFNMDKGLKSYIEKKLSGLEKFYDRIIEVEVYLKVQKTSDKENKISEIRVFIPGEDVVVKKTAKTFEEGVSVGVESLKRSLKKVKEKQRSH
jgi:putative sigma-54 modulation protein